MHTACSSKCLLLLQEEEVSTVAHEQQLQQIVSFVEEHSGAVLADKFDTQLHFTVPRQCKSGLTVLLKQIKVSSRAAFHTCIDWPAVHILSEARSMGSLHSICWCKDFVVHMILSQPLQKVNECAGQRVSLQQR